MLTAFFCVSCDSASVSSALRNSLSMIGLRKRTRCTSLSFSERMPSAHHRFSSSHFDGVLADRLIFCFSMPTTVPVRVPGCVALVCCKHHFDLLAARLVEDGAEGRIAGQVDGEGLQRAFDGGVAVVGDGGDVAAVEVAQHHGLEQVVDVLHRERQIDAGVALDGAFALEVADAAGEQHHLADRQLLVVADGARLGRVAPLWRHDVGLLRIDLWPAEPASS